MLISYFVCPAPPFIHPSIRLSLDAVETTISIVNLWVFSHLFCLSFVLSCLLHHRHHLGSVVAILQVSLPPSLTVCLCVFVFIFLYLCSVSIYAYIAHKHTGNNLSRFVFVQSEIELSKWLFFFSLHFIWSSFVERLKLLFSIIVAVADAVDVVHTNFVFMFVCFFAVQQRFDFIVALSCRYKIL